MDSLTQIVLGAAVGEVCLGKKLGNKAMVWGAIAGTIPDLDIIGNAFLSEIDALAFHRGISHSIFFAVTFSFIIAFFARTWYLKRWHTNEVLRTIGSVFSTLAISVLTGVFCLIGFVLGKWIGLAILGIPAISFWWFIVKRIWTSRGTALDLDTNISYFHWYNFFFWSIFTHPILDCCTVYGTQLLQPFSNARISWDNISVADPIYTFLFGVCVVIASTFHRSDTKRRFYNYLGIGLSMLYMLWTFYNKSTVNGVLEHTIAEEKITYSRYMTSPTILNNILWTGTVEADSLFYVGQYSLFDEKEAFNLQAVPKNTHLLKEEYKEDKTLQILKWFSKDYCAYLHKEDGSLQMNDLRYGQFDLSRGNVPSNYIFRFELNDTGTGYEMQEAEGGPPPEEQQSMFPRLWNRIKGE